MTRPPRFLMSLVSLLAFAAALPLGAQQLTVKPIAGGGPNAMPALKANFIAGVTGLAGDAAGNLYISDVNHVFRMDNSGNLTLLAGTGATHVCANTASDPCPGAVRSGAATEATLSNVAAIAADSGGDVYVADYLDNVVWKIDTAGKISVFAGTGVAGYSGDGGAANQAQLLGPQGVAVDGAGDVFIVAGGANGVAAHVREVSAAGVMSTVAGGGGATQALAYPYASISAVAADGSGHLYVTDLGSPTAFPTLTQITLANGNVTVVAGGGTVAPAAGATATKVSLSGLLGDSVDSAGNVYFATSTAQGGLWEIAAGSSTLTQVIAAPNTFLGAIYVSAAGKLYVGENMQVYEAAAGGASALVAGNGNAYDSFIHAQASDPIYPALNTALDPAAAWSDGSGNVYVATYRDNDSGKPGRLSLVTPDGNIAQIAGGTPMVNPAAVAANAAGTLFVADNLTSTVYAITPAGVVSAYAGNGKTGFSGDGGAATSAQLANPNALAIDGAGNLYIGDSSNHDVRRVDAKTGVITTVAGIVGSGTDSGDGGAATAATFNGPWAVALDGAGNLYIGDSNNPYAAVTAADVSGRIREVNAKTGIITTVAGCACGTQGAGDGAAATAATLGPIGGVAVDGAGNLYIADAFNAKIREVIAASGNIVTLAGNGVDNYSTGTGVAAQTEIGEPMMPQLDAKGNLYFVERNSHRVLEVVNAVGVPVASGASLTFAAQATGTTSASQTVTFTNPGLAADAISGISASGDFSESNNCGTSLAPGATCTVTVTFTPAALGTRSGTLALATNLGATSVALIGTGAAPATAGLLSSALSFGSQATGTTSGAQTITVSNGGGVPLSITSISVTGPFAQTNGCGSSVAAGASCSVSVTFSPTATGAASGALTINDSAAGSPQTVSLSGTGIAPGVAITPSQLAFGSVTVGTPSAALGVTIGNSGSSALTVSAVTASGDFSVAGSCATIPVNGSCSLAVIFTPTATGARTGTLTITDNASSGTQTVPLSGTGAAAGLSLTPANLSFAPTLVGTSSPARTLTLSNSGTTAVSSLTVTAVGAFSAANSCGATLAAGATCTLQVQFTPQVSGAESGALVITSSLGTQAVVLSGTGVAPGANLSVGALQFGGQLSGTSSPAQTVVLTNSGTAALSITSIAASSGFAESNNCTGGTLAVGASCGINVSFAPSSTGPVTGTLTVTAGGTVQTVALSGQGTAPGLALTPPSLAFGAQAVGTASQAQTILVSNNGTAAATLSSISASGDYTLVSGCSTTAPLAPGASCPVSVTFTPSAGGARAGAVVLSGTGGLGSLATLSGTGTQPGILASPAQLSFGSQTVGAPSNPQTVTISNTGSAPLSLSGIAASGDFSAATTCGSSLAAGANCVINVTMNATTTGTRTGTLNLYDSVDGLHPIALTGVGVAAGASLSPSALAFGSQPIPGANAALTGAPQTVVLTNSGTAVLSIQFIAVSGEFTASSTCGASLAAGASCSIAVTFAPVLQGHQTGALTITDSAGTQAVSLAGDGSPNGLVLSPSVLNFGGVTVGQPSQPQTATLTNNSGLAINSLVITASGEFSQTNTCSTGLAASASCTINITLTPALAGPLTGAISFTGALASSASNPALTMRARRLAAARGSSSLAVVAMAGSGGSASLTTTPTSLSFGSEPVGTASAAQTVKLTNGGTVAVSGLTIVSTPDFPFTTTCTSTLAAGANCSVAVTFDPTASGQRTGSLNITASGGLTAQVAMVGAAGAAAPQLMVSPTSLTFASELTGSTSSAQTVTLNNQSNSAISIAGITASGDFATTNTCGSSLAAGASCTAAVTFTPTATGSRSGTLTVTYGGSNTQTVSLSGTGSALTASIASGSSNTASVTAGGTASYGLVFTPSAGASGSFSVSCAGAPQGVNCTAAPTSFTISGTQAAAVTVTVVTTARGSRAVPPPDAPAGWPPAANWALGALGLLLLAGWLGLRGRARRRLVAGIGFCALSLMVACGGGAGSGGSSSTSGTPAGTYTLTVTASGTSGNAVQKLTLIVQ
ncbi:MAG: choice-of-anchor D domain-containing protein [Acidobacteria bacterium]|nr:MAG: choice-of-anchor D domain-containing protein [Acidobacteriota bacterium]